MKHIEHIINNKNISATERAHVCLKEAMKEIDNDYVKKAYDILDDDIASKEFLLDF